MVNVVGGDSKGVLLLLLYVDIAKRRVGRTVVVARGREGARGDGSGYEEGWRGARGEHGQQRVYTGYTVVVAERTVTRAARVTPDGRRSGRTPPVAAELRPKFVPPSSGSSERGFIPWAIGDRLIYEGTLTDATTSTHGPCISCTPFIIRYPTQIAPSRLVFSNTPLHAPYRGPCLLPLSRTYSLTRIPFLGIKLSYPPGSPSPPDQSRPRAPCRSGKGPNRSARERADDLTTPKRVLHNDRRSTTSLPAMAVHLTVFLRPRDARA